MNLSLRTRIFIIISLVVLFILGVSVFLYTRAKNKNNPTTVDSAGNIVPAGSNNSGSTPVPLTNLNNVTVPKIGTIEIQQKAVQNLAKIFVERSNSYTSESHYQNMFDVKSLVTDNYWKQLSAKIPSNTSNVSPNFYAMSTEAYSAKLSSWTDKSATVDLQLKISEEKGGVITKKDAQGKVTLVKNGNDWLVDNFTMVK